MIIILKPVEKYEFVESKVSLNIWLCPHQNINGHAIKIGVLSKDYIDVQKICWKDKIC